MVRPTSGCFRSEALTNAAQRWPGVVGRLYVPDPGLGEPRVDEVMIGEPSVPVMIGFVRPSSTPK